MGTKQNIVHGLGPSDISLTVEVCLLSDQVTKPLLSLFKRELEEDYAAQSLLAWVKKIRHKIKGLHFLNVLIECTILYCDNFVL